MRVKTTLDRQFALTEVSMAVAAADQSGEPLNVVEQAEAILVKYPDCGFSLNKLCDEIQRFVFQVRQGPCKFG